MDPNVDCNAMYGLMGSARIWSLRFEGRCVDIQDTSFSPQYCSQIRNIYRTGSGERIELFTDDSCNAPLTYVQRGESCDALNGVFNNTRVWSVRFRGRCEDIQDTSFLNACRNYSGNR
jgi:hypothetical protein